MGHRLRWITMIVGLLVLAVSGISISSQPDYELLYSTAPPLATCTDVTCLAIYKLEIGNTGWEAQKHVRVRLRDEALQATVRDPTVRNFGVADRPVRVSTEGGVRIYDLGRVQPRERVEVQFVLRYQEPSNAPAWNQVLVSVDTTQGDARPGNPEALTLGRVLYAVFGSLW